jgi:hypothetical protein
MNRALRDLLISAALGVGVVAESGATTIVTVNGPSSPVAVGDTFQITLTADFSAPVLGWGLDLTFDPALVSVVGTPTVDSSWTAVFSPDGDGLVGLAPITGVSGSGVLLATVTLQLLAPGNAVIGVSVTPGDLAEGFPLLPSGFDTIQFNAFTVPLPEPRGLVLLGAAVLTFGRRKLVRNRQ